MKGGLNNPPNANHHPYRRAYRCASMKGGLNNPPNPRATASSPPATAASMKGGLNNPPNTNHAMRAENTKRLQ